MTAPPAFNAPEFLPRLALLSNAELDCLDFGVVEMALDGTVLRYNRTESEQAGLAPEQVIGRNFFQEVALCCNNQHVAQRYEQPSLDETIEYTFSFRMKITPVTLRMLKDAGATVMYLLVRQA